MSDNRLCLLCRGLPFKTKVLEKYVCEQQVEMNLYYFMRTIIQGNKQKVSKVIPVFKYKKAVKEGDASYTLIDTHF